MKSITIEFCRDTPRLHLFRQSLHQKLVELAGEIRLLEGVELTADKKRMNAEEPLDGSSSPASPVSSGNEYRDGCLAGLTASATASPTEPPARPLSVDMSKKNVS